MKTPRTRLLSVALLALLVGALGCSSEQNPLAPAADPAGATKDGLDIVDTAISAGQFGTLVAAVQAAELEGALRSEGPFTVFAPTDGAFAALPDGFVDDLLAPRNFEKLQELLLYHVIAGEIASGDLRWSQFPQTLNGKYVWIRKFWGEVRVNASRVIAADVFASNGVIHVIDKVLIPRGFELIPEGGAPELDLVDTAAAAGAFETLLAAAGAAELVDVLRSEGPLTVFAPTDEAFGRLPQELIDALLMPENQSKLQELLLYHVVAGQVESGDLRFYQRVPTVQGDEVRIIKWFGNVWVNYARVTTADVLATNGVIHVINRVLIPQGFSLDMGDKSFGAEELEALLTEKTRDELPPTEFDPRFIDDEVPAIQ